MFTYIKNSELNSEGTVYFGPQGFTLFSSQAEQEKNHNKFTTDKSWNENWLVVGIDTELGDPYLVTYKNSENNKLTDPSVYTAIFDDNGWSLVRVAKTIEAFVDCLNLINQLTKQTTEIYVPDNSTITDKALLKITEQKLIDISECDVFWQQFFTCYIDWLEN